MIWGRRTTAFQRIPARAPEDDACENLGGGQTECILHGAFFLLIQCTIRKPLQRDLDVLD